MRILAIDDNQDNLTALRAVVSDRLPEAEVLTALSGPAGLGLARNADPDVILLDIVMPGMDGYEVCRELKEDPVLQAIPVLFLTALRTDKASRVKALEAGAEGFLSKPFDDLELTVQIQAMVKIKAAATMQRTENERLAALVEERTRALVHELDERRQAEDALRAGEERLQDITSSMGGWVWETSENGTCTYMSQKGIDLLGVPLEDILGKTPFDFMSPDEAERMAARFSEIVASKAPIVDLEYWLVRPNGERVDVLTNGFPILDEAGNIRGYRGVDRDITGRKRAERFRQLFTEILGVLNQPAPFADTIQRTLAAIKQGTGIEAVGMRLRDGDDFPYFSQDGFSDEFIEAENALAERDESGDVCRDRNGDICLSCTCGLVISGKTAAGNPLFTQGGSCWTNDSSPLLDLTAEEDPRSQPRNRCVHDGYASVALIPIRANGEIVGLLHLNDRRKDCFTLRQIQFFEGVCASIGIALLRNRAQEALRTREKSYRDQFAMNSAVMLLIDPADDAILDANAAALAFYGYSHDQLLAMRITDINTLPAPEVQEAMGSVPQEKGGHFEFRHRLADGSLRDVGVSSSRIQIGERTVLHSIISDITERKRAEKELHETRERLALALRGARLGMWDWQVQTNEALFDDRWTGMLGYAPGEVKPSGDSWERLLHPEDKSRVMEELKRHWDDETELYQTEFRARTKSGDWKWILSCGSVVERDDEGKPLRMVGTHLDITEQKRAENTIHRNEARLRGIVSILQRPAETTDEFLHSALEEAIKLTESKIGYIFSYSEERRQLVLDTYSKEVGEECMIAAPQKVYELDETGIWGEVIRQRKPFLLNDFKSPHPLRKGRPEGHVHLDGFMSVPVFREDQIVAVVGVANKPSDYDQSDVLQLSLLMDSIWRSVAVREGEAALRESEERFQQLFDHMAAGVAVYEGVDEGQDFVFVDMNETGQSFSKLRLRDVVGQRVTEVFPGVVEIGLLDVFRRVWRTGQPEHHPLADYVDDRIEHWVENYVYKLPSGLVVAIYSDTTAQKRAEAETSRLQTELQQAQKMDAIGQLAGGVAHDFNNMLEVIIGNTEFALDDADPTQPMHADLQEVLKAARRSADLTRQLLTFARKQVISPTVLGLNEAVGGMLKMLRRLIGENIDLEWDSKEGLWPVKMDPSQIDQILANLCVNARDAIAGVGAITIRLENVALDEDCSFGQIRPAPGEYVVLSIGDNGCGMDQQTVDQVFEPFFTTKEMGKGTGLGLAAVYGIVQQNAGGIDICSEPGLGTTFAVYLPRHVGAAPAVTGEAAAPALRGTETILVVEDEMAILKMARKMLEKQGYTALAASSPAEAIRLVAAHVGEIDLLITDVIMPEMNGQDLATQLVSLCPHLKCLFMSGYTADAIAPHGVLDEGVHFIQKPFSIRGLAGKVREVLDEDQGAQ